MAETWFGTAEAFGVDLEEVGSAIDEEILPGTKEDLEQYFVTLLMLFMWRLFANLGTQNNEFHCDFSHVNE